MSAPGQALRARNLRTLAGLGGLFFLPLALAFWMYYGTDWRPGGHVNHGALISPPRMLPVVNLPSVLARQSVPHDLFRRKWSLVYIGHGGCDAACRNTLYVMRQTRLALNNQMTRVDRVFLVTDECCDRDFLAHEHAGLIVLDAAGGPAAALVDRFPAANREQSLFVVDPLGNLMMSFDVRQDPKGLLQDLRKLLTLSHIG
ncbi:MAG: SCO family protein [Steroidobacteraceae bacterium]